MSVNFVPQNLLPIGVSVKSNCPVVESKSLLGHHTFALDDKRVSSVDCRPIRIGTTTTKTRISNYGASLLQNSVYIYLYILTINIRSTTDIHFLGIPYNIHHLESSVRLEVDGAAARGVIWCDLLLRTSHR